MIIIGSKQRRKEGIVGRRKKKSSSMNTGKKEDGEGGWKFQGRKKKGIKYSVGNFLKLKEKEIKAERIEEEDL